MKLPFQQDALGKVNRLPFQQDALGKVNRVKENPAGCAGEGKQSKGSEEKRKGRFRDNRQLHFVMKARVESVR